MPTSLWYTVHGARFNTARCFSQDEDNSNEIDYNEFANSGVMGGKFFAARNPLSLLILQGDYTPSLLNIYKG